MLLQTSQQNLFNDTVTVNGRPYRVDADGVAEIAFEEDSGKLLGLGGWSTEIKRVAKAPVVEQGKFKGGPAFIEVIALGSDLLARASKFSSYPGLSSFARGSGYLLSTEEAFRADLEKFTKLNGHGGETIFRAIPWLRPALASNTPRPLTPSEPAAKAPAAPPAAADAPPPSPAARLGIEDEDEADDTDEGAGEGAGEGSEQIPQPSMSMSKADLQGWATRYQIPYDDKTTKKDLVDLLEKAMYPAGR